MKATLDLKRTLKGMLSVGTLLCGGALVACSSTPSTLAQIDSVEHDRQTVVIRGYTYFGPLASLEPDETVMRRARQACRLIDGALQPSLASATRPNKAVVYVFRCGRPE